MSIVEPDKPSTRKFLTVDCPCGRALRATPDMAGQEISCWECHRMVRVPVPRSPERAFRVIQEGLQEVFEARWLTLLFVGAAALTGVLCVPRIGVPLSTIVLFVGALGYGELIRQCGTDYWDFDDWKDPRQFGKRVAVAALLALGVASPMLLSRGGFGESPRFTNLGILVGLLGVMTLPVLMFVIYARDNRGPIGWRRGLSVLARYPIATLLALSLVPIGVVFSETVVACASGYQGMLPFMVLDLFPGSEYFAEQYKIPKYGNYTKFEFPGMRFIHLYFRRLHQGYSLTGALPASLSKKTFILGSPWTLELTDSSYLLTRAFYTHVSAMVLFVFFALQSRFLGAISSLDSSQSPAPEVEE